MPLNKQADFINGMQVSPVTLSALSSCRPVWDDSTHAAEHTFQTPKSGIPGYKVLPVGLHHVRLSLQEHLREG